ncbi:MAG: chorismate mutase [Candidatus Bathyarchaeia archaeon]
MATIEDLRRRIDNIDEQILILLKRRVDLAREIARTKSGMSLPIRDEVRERVIIDRAVKWAQSEGLNQEITGNIFKEIIELCIDVEEKLET